MNHDSKRVDALFILVFLSLFLSMPLFAQQAIAQLEGLANTIKGILTGNLVKTILAIALICSFIAFAVNKDNQRVRSSSIAVGLSAAVIMAATFIIDILWID